MIRRNFLVKTAKISGGICLSPTVLTYCQTNKGKEIAFEIVTEIAVDLVIQGCTYAFCLVTIKNHQVCNVIAKAMSFVADEMAEKIQKGIEDIGAGEKIEWIVEKYKENGKEVARISYKLFSESNTIDVLKTIGCPDGGCSGQILNWNYVGVFGIGKFPEASSQYLDAQYLNSLNDFDRCILRNEMYARHGYRFHRNYQVQKYFESQEWYQSFPTNLRRYDGDWGEFISNHYFNKYEKSNLKVLLEKFTSDCNTFS